MPTLLTEFFDTFLSTIGDVAPIVLLVILFQTLVIKKQLPNLRKTAVGVVFVIIGLTFFLLGLQKALFPLGETMALQLTSSTFIRHSGDEIPPWQAYYWLYIFSAFIGFSTTIAEPSLKAVAMKAAEVSGGTISVWGLRVIVAFGAGFALALGMFRIVTGTPLYVYLIVCYVVIIVQTIFAPKDIVALAYDSGGVTTSTVTVPIVAALGLGLSGIVPGRNPALDGFGLIALVCMFPIITVLGYAQILSILTNLSKK